MMADGANWLVMVVLGDGVYMSAELLGTSWLIERGVSGTLVLPSPPSDYKSPGWMLEPTPIAGAERALAWFSEPVGEAGEPVWGSGYEGQENLRSITRTYVRAGLLVLPAIEYDADSEGRAVLDGIATAMDAFVDDLCEWLEVLGGADVIAGRRTSRMTPRHTHPLALVVRPDGTLGHLPTMQLLTGYSGPPGIEPARGMAGCHGSNECRRSATGGAPAPSG